jgi:hypothetical protein
MYIRRFIANLSGKIQPFTRLTKKDIPFKWDSECQQAFEEIKTCLLNPLVLAAPVLGKELILYTTTLDGWESCWRKKTGKVIKICYIT